MANAREGNVLVVDTTATFSDQLEICAIKYIGAASSSAAIAMDGVTVWQEAASTNVNDIVKIWAKDGITVTITGTAKVYLYLKA